MYDKETGRTYSGINKVACVFMSSYIAVYDMLAGEGLEMPYSPEEAYKMCYEEGILGKSCTVQNQTALIEKLSGGRYTCTGEYTKISETNGQMDTASVKDIMDTVDSQGHVNIRMSVGHSMDVYGYKVMDGKVYLCVNDTGRNNQNYSFKYISTTDSKGYVIDDKGVLQPLDNRKKNYGTAMKYRKITKKENKK